VESFGMKNIWSMINKPILLSQFINTTNKKTMKTTMIKKALLSAMMLMSYASVRLAEPSHWERM